MDFAKGAEVRYFSIRCLYELLISSSNTMERLIFSFTYTLTSLATKSKRQIKPTKNKTNDILKVEVKCILLNLFFGFS
jgi:hypothetical protein